MATVLQRCARRSRATEDVRQKQAARWCGSQVRHTAFSNCLAIWLLSGVVPLRSPHAPLAILASLFAAAPVLAQDDAPPPSEQSGAGGLSGDWLVIGAGAATFPEYEGSKNTVLLPLPGAVGSLGGVTFQVFGTTASVSVASPPIAEKWRVTIGPVANYSTNRTYLSSVSDVRVRALGRVKPAIELGGSVGIVGSGVITSDFDRLSVSVAYRHDVNGAHGGNMLKTNVTYLMPVSRKAMLLFMAQADHADDKYAATYFSISPAQSTASGLPGYSAKGGWKNWTLAAATSVSLTGDLTGGLALVGGVSYSRLLNDFAASPVTSVAGSRNQWMAGVGLAYTF